ncbi:hypothetical protein CCP3SC15_1010007 [Gammaproteobacteria bacterium]
MAGTFFVLQTYGIENMLLIAWWLNRHAVHKKTPELDWLRRWALHYGLLGGTDFRDAEMTGADFSGSDLWQAQFTGAILAGTRWRGAKNLHFADTDTYDTPLQAKSVRQLLVSGIGENQDFSGKDLGGMDFSGMKLSGTNFTDADLSKARFIDADLIGAKLTRTVLLDVNFSKAKMSGVYIGHWNIDKNTRFDGVDCEYVYLDEAGNERQPGT